MTAPMACEARDAARITELTAENEGLRAALTKIRDMHPSVTTLMQDGSWRSACRDLQSIARLALADAEGSNE